MILDIDRGNAALLHAYCADAERAVPYAYPAVLELWMDSLFDDMDGEGSTLFDALKTYVFLQDHAVKGYIQFGKTAFSWVNDQKSANHPIGDIRGFHYDPQAPEIGEQLLRKADAYFESQGLTFRHAFYHYFGMTCRARHGKLHASGFWMEPLLAKHGYEKEHENVFFTRDLSGWDAPPQAAIAIEFGGLSRGGECDMAFLLDGQPVGGGTLHFLPQPHLAYLRWIYINDTQRHQGLGTRCMHQLFSALQARGITRLDTDTMDSNHIAQGYYTKTGFVNAGRTRSYSHRDNP